MSQRTETALKLWVVLSRAQNSISDALRKQVEAHGLSFTEFGVLEALLHKGMLPMGELGDRILRTSGSMTYVVDKLEKKGLLSRVACAEDRRIVYVDLTEAGRDRIEAVFPEHAELIDELMEPLSVEERQVTARLVKRVGLRAAAHAGRLEPAT